MEVEAHKGREDAMWAENMTHAWLSYGGVIAKEAASIEGGGDSVQPNPVPSTPFLAVLDDNCTLCLPNGERIKLNATTMRMLFEVHALG